MKILLINPPQTIPVQAGTPYIFQPLGIAYIASVLEKEHDVRILDANVEGSSKPAVIDGNYHQGLSIEEIKERVKEVEPDIVGITIPFTINSANAFKVALAVKSITVNITTIVGGPHTSIKPEEVVTDPAVDFAVIGEGEATIIDLVRIIQNEAFSELDSCDGIAYKKDGLPAVTHPRKPIEDLDSIPFPARHLLPMKKYFASAAEGRSSRMLYDHGLPWGSMVSSRGCPFNCSFCSIKITMGQRFRLRSPDNVIAEIENMIEAHGISSILFEDDNLTFNKDRLKDICDQLIEKSWGIVWGTPNGIRADIIDEALVQKMHGAGCKRVFVAPESGVQHVVTNIIRKNMDLQKVEHAVTLFKKYGIIVDASFVIGSIGETKKDILKTILYALKLKRLGVNKAGFHIATPLYGTRLYDEARQHGYLKADISDQELSTANPLIETPDWSRADLRQLHRVANWTVNFGPRDKIISIFRHIPELSRFIRLFGKAVKQNRPASIPMISKVRTGIRLFKNSIRTAALDSSGRLPDIHGVVFEVTDACNSRCTHCSIWKNKPSYNMLNTEEIMQVFSDSALKNLKQLIITGGEASLRPDISEIILKISRMVPGINITFSTNGLLPDRVVSIVKEILENGFSITVGISLDGIGTGHDDIRGVKGNFQKVDRLLRELDEFSKKYNGRLRITVGHTLSRQTAASLNETEKYLRDSISTPISFLSQLYEEFPYYSNLGLNRHSNEPEMIKALEQLFPSIHNEIIIRHIRRRAPKKFRCRSMRSFFLLRCNGDISPCLKYCDNTAGNIRGLSLSSIWEGHKAAEARTLVNRCSGCSNSWAANWSFQAWCLPFIDVIAACLLKKASLKLKKSWIAVK